MSTLVAPNWLASTVADSIGIPRMRVDHDAIVKEARQALKAAKKARKAHGERLAAESAARAENARLRDIAVLTLEDVCGDVESGGRARADAAEQLLNLTN